MTHRLRLDPIRCDGYGLCAEALPELIALDEWGYPIIAGGAVPQHLLRAAGRAVDVCPVLALRLQRVIVDGVPPAGSRRLPGTKSPARLETGQAGHRLEVVR